MFIETTVGDFINTDYVLRIENNGQDDNGWAAVCAVMSDGARIALRSEEGGYGRSRCQEHLRDIIQCLSERD